MSRKLSYEHIDKLIDECARQSNRFFTDGVSEDESCFELFRRAIVHRNQVAWEAIYNQYHKLVRYWIQHCSSAYFTHEDDIQSLVNATFAKFWHSIPPEKFDNFKSLRALLGYLKLCAGSATTDRIRRQKYQTLLTDLEEVRTLPSDDDIEQSSLDKAAREQFWAYIQTQLKDEDEWFVIYHTFVLGWKPRDIQKEFPQRFPDVKDVYRVKRNVLDRLRRSEGMRRWME
nr:hypothetical protein [Ardenticatena sp.]